MSKLTIKSFAGNISVASRRTRWLISRDSPKSVDDLTFTSRDAENRLCWWDVTPPNTTYWHAHEVLGRAYAFELLDLMNNPEAEPVPYALRCIAEALSSWRPPAMPWAAEPMRSGFFGVLGEYLATGTADR